METRLILICLLFASIPLGLSCDERKSKDEQTIQALKDAGFGASPATSVKGQNPRQSASDSDLLQYCIQPMDEKPPNCKETIARLNQALGNVTNPQNALLFHRWRATAELLDGDLQAVKRDLQAVSQSIDPKDGDWMSIATQVYWIELTVACVNPIKYKLHNGGSAEALNAADFSNIARSIRLIEHGPEVDSDALKVAELLADIFDRNARAGESIENGDDLLRIIAGAFEGKAAERFGQQLDQSIDLGEANRYEFQEIRTLSDGLQRRYGMFFNEINLFGSSAANKG